MPSSFVTLGVPHPSPMHQPSNAVTHVLKLIRLHLCLRYFRVFTGTWNYAPPEILCGNSYRGPECDIWYTVLSKLLTLTLGTQGVWIPPLYSPLQSKSVPDSARHDRKAASPASSGEPKLQKAALRHASQRPEETHDSRRRRPRSLALV